MKFYMIIDVEYDENDIEHIVFRKRVFILKEDAFKEALKRSNGCCVIELAQVNCWNTSQIARNMSKDDLNFFKND